MARNEVTDRYVLLADFVDSVFNAANVAGSESFSLMKSSRLLNVCSTWTPDECRLDNHSANESKPADVMRSTTLPSCKHRNFKASFDVGLYTSTFPISVGNVPRSVVYELVAIPVL